MQTLSTPHVSGTPAGNRECQRRERAGNRFSITTVRFVINGQAEKSTVSAKKQKKQSKITSPSTVTQAQSRRAQPQAETQRYHRFCRSRPVQRLFLPLDGRTGGSLPKAEPALADRCLARRPRAGESRRYQPAGALASMAWWLPRHQKANLPQLVSNKAQASIVMFDRDYGSAQFPVVSDNFQGGVEMTHSGCWRQQVQRFISSASLPNCPVSRGGSTDFCPACEASGVPDGEVLLRFRWRVRCRPVSR